ncbi:MULTISPECIES: aminopeptidase N [Brucella]|uniref:Aminopeptidase N n=3 Tax=Brucella lupini TaxID=255457 RepID=A0A256H126_9HYPH|nr:aminopeptidase N [Brucella lupini]KAB2702130.1 aminopeptidase N [Brucella lupini]OYR32890.1 aminopeptidase N [Brucella lupini]
MRTETGQTFRLEDYRPTPYAIPETKLDFSLEPEKTIVRATLTIERRDGTAAGTPLILDGDELKLVSIAIDGKQLTDNSYIATPDQLEISDLPEGKRFTLEVVTEINPTTNRQLSGLYRSSGVYCTQCEAEGFRRITYYYDRPDVLSVYTVRVDANEQAAPILLSNGNPVESGSVEGTPDRHFAIWHDPHPKPSYLFALVAGSLGVVKDHFTTKSGQPVDLAIYVEHGKEGRALYAMDALKRSMRWDEEKFGREYDLDVFNIVAVSDFNMGAMENKGLNVFNDKYVLADPETATDVDYAGIEAVIAHEYFHNWTGNRITCRDWFQLCLKEGLTVYRDHEFSADERSRPVKRIAEVKILKAQQFPEDAGPLAHPVRPREYREINNFYTATVYEKGSEVVRMIRTIIGPELFRKGMDLYFERHDGEAATIEDFIKVFADVSGQDFSQFALWYDQAGTPKVEAAFSYDAAKETFSIELAQSLGATPGQSVKKPMHIPITYGLIGSDGEDMVPTSVEGGDVRGDVIHLHRPSETIVFHGIKERSVPSLLRGFSAPVNLSAPLSDDDRAFLALNDSDPVARWHALTGIFNQALLEGAKRIRGGHAPAVDDKIIELAGNVASDETLDPAFRALCLTLPSESDIAREMGSNVDPDAILASRNHFVDAIAARYAGDFTTLYDALKQDGAFSPDAGAAGKRALRNVLLDYLSRHEKSQKRATSQFANADNMTDRFAALAVLVHRFGDTNEAKDALASFERQFGKDGLVMDKWFSVQASRPGDEALQAVHDLTKHALFSLDNPNRVRSVIGSFSASNPTGFNRKDGAAYEFFADTILSIDPENPQLAARLLTALRSWRSLEDTRREHARAALARISGAGKLSTDLRDIVDRTLA